MSQVVRVLARRRLSRELVSSTSLDRQESYITDWCEQMTRETAIPHEIIGWADDVDVSGSVDPFKTDGLGPWLTDEKSAEWDVLCCWKIDRLSRTTLNSYKLLQWCKARGKRIKATNDLIDPDSRMGELLWFIISWLAEGELEAIQDRTRGTREWLIQTDQWPGGTIPYGYVQIKNPDGKGWVLIKDDGMMSILELMIGWIIVDGLSSSKVAESLNALGIPGPYAGRGYKPRGKNRTKDSLNGQWSTTAVIRILRSKNLLGIRTKADYTTDPATGKKIKGETSVVLDKETGMPVKFGHPLISPARYAELQEALDLKAQPRDKSVKPDDDDNSLPEIAKCAVCGRRMYRHMSGEKGKQVEYFICSGKRGTNRLTGAPKCVNRLVKRVDVWTHLETYLLDELGDKPWQKRTIIPGQNHTDEIKQAQDAMALLLDKISMVSSKPAIEAFSNQIEALDAKIVKLTALPVSERRDGWEDTGKTFREHWESLTLDQQVQLLHLNQSHVSVLRWPGELTSPHLRPDLPMINFGGIPYALIPGEDRSHRSAQLHVVLGGQLQRMLQGV